MKKNPMKLITITLILTSLITGCSSSGKEDSATANLATTQAETQASATEEATHATQTENTNTEESPADAETVSDEAGGIDLESIAAEMGYTDFLLNGVDGEKMIGYHVPESWVKDTEIDAPNLARYTTVDPQSVDILWLESEAFANLPESFIEYTNNEEPDDYYKSKEAELICELEVPAYGTSYLFHITYESTDPNIGYMNNYEVIIPSKTFATSVSLSLISSDQESNVNALKEVIEQLFGKTEQQELSEDYQNYLQTTEGVKLIGYNLPEGYELNPSSTDESRQQVSYKNGEKLLTIYASISGDMMNSLYDTGHYTEDVTGKEYTERDSVETAYGTVKLYEVTTGLSSNTSWREEMALVKSKGQLYIVLYTNLADEYYTNATAGDEWKGDIKNIVQEIF